MKMKQKQKQLENIKFVLLLHFLITLVLINSIFGNKINKS